MFELLIPAGNLEKLRTAMLYGADAVYVGAAGLSLRARQSEFSLDDLAIGVKEAHQQGVKVYAAMNLFARNEDLPKAEQAAKELNELGIDGLIVSDPGMIRLVRQVAPEIPLHLSTQANTTNSEAVTFWKEQGIQRVVLARELSLAEVGEIAREVPDVEYELFVHGAMCMAYSGRCFLSAHWNQRSSNRGDCTQPCRWEYKLVEQTRPKVPLILEEDDRYSYLLSSKDLCMLAYIPELFVAGVNSLKVEGRMKTVYYVAAVTRIYRQAIDEYLKDPQNYQLRPEWLEELQKVSYRGYTTGFYFTDEKINEINPDTNYIQTHDFVGTVLGYDPAAQRIEIAVRNGIYSEDRVELLLPQQVVAIDLTRMIDKKTGKHLTAAHNGYEVSVPLQVEVPVTTGMVVRREKN